MSRTDESWRGIDFACPRCRGAVESLPEAFHCGRCDVRYPIILGIPDFRVAPDPWIGLEADREKGMRLEHETEGQGLAATVRAYWAMTPDTPAHLARRFITHVEDAEERSREWLARRDARPREVVRPWIDLGCGTGDLAAATGPGVRVVGIDVAFRWLVVARRRLRDRGIAPLLVCCNAEALPFADETFGCALSLGTLEHCKDAVAVMREARRVLAAGAGIQLRTANRFSLFPEPHVGVWGVGWMPRRWADRYVRWRSGERYLHHWPKGPWEIRRAMRRAGFDGVHVAAAPMLAADLHRVPAPIRRLAPAYERLRSVPLVGGALRAVAPLLEARGVAR